MQAAGAAHAGRVQNTRRPEIASLAGPRPTALLAGLVWARTKRVSQEFLFMIPLGSRLAFISALRYTSTHPHTQWISFSQIALCFCHSLEFTKAPSGWKKQIQIPQISTMQFLPRLTCLCLPTSHSPPSTPRGSSLSCNCLSTYVWPSGVPLLRNATVKFCPDDCSKIHFSPCLVFPFSSCETFGISSSAYLK